MVIRTYCIMLLLTLLSISFISCGQETILTPEDPTRNWIQYDPATTHEARPFTIIPEPGKIAHNQSFGIWFSSSYRPDGVANVRIRARIRNTLSEHEIRAVPNTRWGDKRTWIAGRTISEITSVSDDPIYFIVTWTSLDKEYEPLVYSDKNGRALVSGQIVGPYYVTAPDNDPPLILNSTVLPPRDPSLGAYPGVYKSSDYGEPEKPVHLKGRTDVDPNTEKIIMLFNKPIVGGAIISGDGHGGLGWDLVRQSNSGDEHGGLGWNLVRQSNYIILDELTPEELRKWQEETAVTKQVWVGTPLDTPWQHVEGKFVDVKVPTVHGSPSISLKPGKTYKITISIRDMVGLRNEIIITFQTAP